MYQEEFSDLITIDELCELLSIGRNYAYSLLNSGEIKAFRIGRIWKIPRGAVWEYIKRKSGLQQPYFSFAKTATPFLLPLPGTAALKITEKSGGFCQAVSHKPEPSGIYCTGKSGRLCTSGKFLPQPLCHYWDYTPLGLLSLPMASKSKIPRLWINFLVVRSPLPDCLPQIYCRR